MIGATAVVMLVVPFISALVVRNETTVTDFGTTTVSNQSKGEVSVNINSRILLYMYNNIIYYTSIAQDVLSLL